jgi:hypothetical protein
MYVGTKFHLSGTFGSLFIAMEPKPKENYLTTAMLLSEILQNITLTKVANYLKIYYQTSFQSPKLSVTSTSQFRASALALLIIRNSKI